NIPKIIEANKTEVSIKELYLMFSNKAGINKNKLIPTKYIEGIKAVVTKTFTIIFCFLPIILFLISANVLALGEEADFEALNCLPALNLIRSTNLHLSTDPAFLPNA